MLSVRIVSVIRSTLLALVAAVCFTLAAGAQDTSGVSLDGQPARNVGVLRAGDVLKVAVFRDPELTGEYLIDSQGYLQIPGLGVVQAAGLSPVDITTRLRDQLLRRGVADPEIAVQPLIRVSVLGEVQKPGLYPVEPGTNVIQLLTISGGGSDRANLLRAHVIRDGRSYPLDLASAMAGGSPGRIVLYSNDVLVVPRRTGLTRENLGMVFAGAGVLLSLLNIAITLQR